MRRTFCLRIGGEGEIPVKLHKNSEYLKQWMDTVKKKDSQQKTSILTDEDLQRLAISTHSPENYFNNKKKILEPSWTVHDEQETNYGPTRYGDWEKNGRCIDF